MCNSRILVNEKYGMSSWNGNIGCIKLCFANLVLCRYIDELKDFMKGLYYAKPIEKTNSINKEISVYLQPTPMQSMQLAFTPKEHQYLLGLCQRSILLAEKLVIAN